MIGFQYRQGYVVGLSNADKDMVEYLAYSTYALTKLQYPLPEYDALVEGMKLLDGVIEMNWSYPVSRTYWRNISLRVQNVLYVTGPVSNSDTENVMFLCMSKEFLDLFSTTVPLVGFGLLDKRLERPGNPKGLQKVYDLVQMLRDKPVSAGNCPGMVSDMRYDWVKIAPRIFPPIIDFGPWDTAVTDLITHIAKTRKISFATATRHATDVKYPKVAVEEPE